MDANTANHIERHEITSREMWLELRKQDVTASVVASLFFEEIKEKYGDVPLYLKTLSELFWEKSGKVLPEVTENKMMRKGRRYEKVVAADVAEERPEWHISKANEYFRDPTLRLGATPDFFIRNGKFGVLQTKVVNPFVFKKYWIDKETGKSLRPPIWIELQTLTEMMLTDAGFGVVAALEVGNYQDDLHIYEIPRHQGAEDRIRRRVSKFWQDVENGVEPPINYGLDGDLIAALFPREEPGKVVDLRADNRMPQALEWHDRYSRYEKLAKKKKDALTTEIKSKIGDAESARVNGWKVSPKEQPRAGYEVKPTSYRVLRATRQDETRRDMTRPT